MATVLGLLVVSGFVLVLSAVYPALRPFPYVTGRGRALRLKILSDKLAVHLETSTESTAKCYQILSVLVGTTAASEKYRMQIVAKESVWRRARRRVLFNSSRGESISEAMLRKEPEPGVLLARQRFRSIGAICSDCPMLRLQPKELPKSCPSMGAFEG